MTFLEKLERKFGRYAISNVALYIVLAQVVVLVAALLNHLDLRYLVLVPKLVFYGEWWRVFTFLLLPPPPGLLGYLFVAFAWYIFYIMSEALEGEWGVFRFNLFLLLGWLITVSSSFLFPLHPVTNGFIAGSVFLAFAFLNPNFQLMLFFVIPVKIKWLALITWVFYGYSFIIGTAGIRIQILASVGNFLIFFTPSMFRRARQVRRKQKFEQQYQSGAAKARHQCVVCGKTNLTHPMMDFRYCSKCSGDECYCEDHIRNHVHVTAADADE